MMKNFRNLSLSTVLLLVATLDAGAQTTCNTHCPSGDSFVLTCGPASCNGKSGAWTGSSITVIKSVKELTSVTVMSAMHNAPVCHYNTDNGPFQATAMSLNCIPDETCSPPGFNCSTASEKKK